jgi:putative transposase
MTVIAAMGIGSDGHKCMLGLTAGGTENQEAVKALLTDLLDRGLAADQSRLFVLDGGKALHKAVTDTFGGKAAIQRCQVHKKRDVLAQLSKSERANTGLQMSMAYLENDYENAKKALDLLAHDLEHRYPKAAASLREVLEETLTVHRLKVPGLLRQTLSNTNAMESANSVAASVIKRVKTGMTASRSFAMLLLDFSKRKRVFAASKAIGKSLCLLPPLKEN